MRFVIEGHDGQEQWLNMRAGDAITIPPASGEGPSYQLVFLGEYMRLKICATSARQPAVATVVYGQRGITLREEP